MFNHFKRLFLEHHFIIICRFSFWVHTFVFLSFAIVKNVQIGNNRIQHNRKKIASPLRSVIAGLHCIYFCLLHKVFCQLLLLSCWNTLRIFSCVLRDSTPRYVRPYVGWSVGPLFTFSAFLSVLSPLLLSKCPSDLLHHCSCPPARD